MSSNDDINPINWIVIAVVAFVLIVAAGFASWGISVLLSNPAGAGGAIKQRNSTVNRVQKQEMFEQLAADYDGYVAKITIAKASVKTASTDVDRQIAQTNLDGVRQECVDSAQQFNAESRKYTSRVWKSAGLPPTLDTEGCTS